MKEYKRLTETLSHYINGKPCKPYGHCLADCNKQMSFVNPERKANGCGECQHFEKVLTRLAELEDKIENGTLVELPCKVGDTVYVINGKDELEKAVVLNYAINKLGYNFDVSSKDTNEEYYLFDFDFNKDWFLTKAEAKKKLKDLQNGK